MRSAIFLASPANTGAHNRERQQIQQKLKTLSYLKLNLRQKLQQVMAANLLNAVLVSFKKNKQGMQVSPAAIQKAINLLISPK